MLLSDPMQVIPDKWTQLLSTPLPMVNLKWMLLPTVRNRLVLLVSTVWDSGQNHSSKLDSELLENSNLRDDDVSNLYLHIVETTKNSVNKLGTIRNLNFNLFGTQEENAGDNMSTVMVKLIKHTEKDTVND